MLVGTSLLQTGCFGEFEVTKAVFNFHESIGGQDKMGTVIRSIPLWIPIGEVIYAVAGIADIVVFNLVEFWTETNPLPLVKGDFEEQLVVKNGETFKLLFTKNYF